MVAFCSIFLTCFLSTTILIEVTSTDPKIVGGFEADKGQFPYQVSLKYSGNHRCGGTIVDSRHLVTAAHCVSENKKTLPVGKLKVDVGTTSKSGAGGVSHSIETIHVPDDYSTNPLITNDIAILRIKGSFSFNEFVQPLPLAEEVYATDDDCIISGWGETQSSEKKLPEPLHYAVVKTMDPYYCQSLIGNSIAPDMLCAGYSTGGIDACRGDSGGPLVCSNGLTGVVSYGYGCGIEERPGLYTDVQVHKKWISDILTASSTVLIPFASLMFSIVILNLFIFL